MKRAKYKFIFSCIAILGICLYSIHIYGNLSHVGFDPNRTIVLGGDNYFPPFEYVDEKGVYKGFNVDLMRAIAIEVGINIEIRPMPWYQAIVALQNGEIDGIQGMKYSEERNAIFDFSESYLISSQSIFVRSDNKHIVHIDDLKGKKVAIQRNDIAMDLLKHIPDIDFHEVENQELALKKLFYGEVDACLGNRLTGLYIVQRNEYTKEIKIVGEDINPEKYCIAVNKGNEELLNILNTGLENIKKNGTYDKIYKKWFGEPINPPYVYVKRIIYILTGILLISFIIMYIFYRWNYILKKEVDKRTEELKRESVFKEQTLNSIFSGLLTLNKQGIILSANKKAEHFLSTLKEELIGKHYEETVVKNFFYSGDIDEVLKTGLEKKGVEKNLNINGESRIFEYNIYPLIISEDNIYGVTVTFADITNEKILREKIVMKDKLESLGRLVAGIAHEIRNPLTSIKAYVELIPFKYNQPDFREKIAIDVPQEIERLNEIINNLLEYSRPRIPQKEQCNICETVMGIIRFFNNEIEKNHIKVWIDIEDHFNIDVDRQQFKQILINFLLNAVQAVKDRERPLIRVIAKKKNNVIHIMIEDNGPGISKENRNKIFEPFFTTKEYGTGLGLFISYQFAKENGGEVSVESEIGIGTRMIITFPCSQ